MSIRGAQCGASNNAYNKTRDDNDSLPRTYIIFLMLMMDAFFYKRRVVYSFVVELLLCVGKYFKTKFCSRCEIC